MSVEFLVIDDRRFLEHAPGNWPEGPHRLEAIWTALTQTGVREALVFDSPCPAAPEDLALVHTKGHIEGVKKISEQGGGYLTLDTVVTPRSYETALLAAGGTMKAVDAVLDGKARRAAALVRPPGHHATSTEGMGFCLFNNIAVAAAHALSRRQLERVLIVDWDLHHGNGTEAMFYSSRRVLFFSCHESPAYPGTGWITDVGEEEGEGYTINVPMPPGSGDLDYRDAFEKVLLPAARTYRPDIILVSCGLDAHRLDPLGHIELSTAGYGVLTQLVCSLADTVCDGRLVFVLEGGYDPIGLGWGMASILNVASGLGGPLEEPPAYARAPGHTARSALARDRLSSVIATQEAYWPLEISRDS